MRYMVHEETGKVFQYDQNALRRVKELRICTDAEVKVYEKTLPPPPQEEKRQK